MTNQFFVGMDGDDGVVVLRHVGELTRAESLNLVTWIAVLCRFSEEELRAARREVEDR